MQLLYASGSAVRGGLGVPRTGRQPLKIPPSPVIPTATPDRSADTRTNKSHARAADAPTQAWPKQARTEQEPLLQGSRFRPAFLGRTPPGARVTRERGRSAPARLGCGRPGAFRVAQWKLAAVATVSWRGLCGSVRRKLPVGLLSSHPLAPGAPSGPSRANGHRARLRG